MVTRAASTWCGEADINAGSGCESDENRRSKRQVENITDSNVEVNGDTSNKFECLLGRNRALLIGLDRNEGRGVVEQADPCGHVNTRADVKSDNAETSVNSDLGTQTESESQVNLGLKLDISAEDNGQSLSEKTFTMAVLAEMIKQLWNKSAYRLELTISLVKRLISTNARSGKVR